MGRHTSEEQAPWGQEGWGVSSKLIGNDTGRLEFSSHKVQPSSRCKTPCLCSRLPRQRIRVRPAQQRSPSSGAVAPRRRLGPALWLSQGHQLGKA